MTLIAALVFGVVSGFAVQDRRRAALSALVPWLAVLAFQTWYLGSGRGNHPASTISEVGYWVVQVVLLAVCLLLAAGTATLRARRTEAAPSSATH